MKEDIMFEKYIYYIERCKEDKLYLNGVSIKKYKNQLLNYFKRKKKDIVFSEKEGYKQIDLSHITEYKTHIIPANFESFDFSKMEDVARDEDGKTNGVLWANCKYVNGKFQRDHYFNLGDEIYIYYTNVSHGDNRILIRVEVVNDGIYEIDHGYCIEKNPYTKNHSMLYETENIKKMLTIQDNAPAILVKLTGYIKPEDEKKYTYNNLKDKNGRYNFIITQAKRYLDEEDANQKLLIEDLEKSTEKASTYSDLINRFSRECLFSKKEGFNKRENHATFLKQNGLLYYEAHHLIERHAAKTFERPESILQNELKKYLNPSQELDNLFSEKELDEKFNLYTICANCHNRIHYGKVEDRREMLKLLYNDEDHHEELNTFLRSKGVLVGQEFNFILCLYGIFENTEKENL